MLGYLSAKVVPTLVLISLGSLSGPPIEYCNAKFWQHATKLVWLKNAFWWIKPLCAGRGLGWGSKLFCSILLRLPVLSGHVLQEELSRHTCMGNTACFTTCSQFYNYLSWRKCLHQQILIPRAFGKREKCCFETPIPSIFESTCSTMVSHRFSGHYHPV